jgi:hypothetical protein
MKQGKPYEKKTLRQNLSLDALKDRRIGRKNDSACDRPNQYTPLANPLHGLMVTE